MTSKRTRRTKTSTLKSGLAHIDIVRKELLRRKGDWRDIERTSGLNYRWLVSFVRKEIKDPGHARFHALASALGFEVTVDNPEARCAESVSLN